MTAEEYIRDNWGESWLKNQWEAGDVIEAMEEYAEQRIREELVKFCEHFEIELDPIDRNLIIDEYLK